MITVFLLTAVEKLINFALNTDKITQAGLEPLAGKVLRLNMVLPELHLDVVFNETHIRFEPVKFTSVFDSPNDDDASRAQPITPDCIISVDNPIELMNLIRHPEGNLPIEGDYRVLMQMRQLMTGFDLDIVTQLEPFIGVSLASQLTQLLNSLKSSFSDTTKNAFNDVADWATDKAGYGKPNPEEQAKVNDLHQQLLKLRADVEREQAKLDAIKQQQRLHKT